jgi:hypothetical protein
MRRNDDYSSAVVLATDVKTPSGASQSVFERLLNRPFKVPGGPKSDFERLLERDVRPKPGQIKRVPLGSPIAVGGVLLIGADALSNIVRQTATLETLTAVGKILDKQPRLSDCAQCVKRALWSQKNIQKKERVKIRRRIGGVKP